MTTDTIAEHKPFQAEVAELLNLMVHSVYSETDIFLRELISNASDALDKLRYEAIAAPELVVDGEPPKIRIQPDKKAGTLAVVDNGIGMDRQELIDNLGTIARSGTKSFLSRLAEAKDGAGLIGQFGVGFYAAFMVADRITVTSRRAGQAEVWTWSSSGGNGFDIAPASDEDARRVTRGAEIVLHLKPRAVAPLSPRRSSGVVGATRGTKARPRSAHAARAPAASSRGRSGTIRPLTPAETRSSRERSRPRTRSRLA